MKGLGVAPSVLPDPASRNVWGWFGYVGTVCDNAIRADNAAMLAECLARDFFDPDGEMLNFKTVRQVCKETAPACYAMLNERSPEAA
jgi:hypothetical protein